MYVQFILRASDVDTDSKQYPFCIKVIFDINILGTQYADKTHFF